MPTTTEIIDLCLAKGEATGLDSLTQSERVVYLATWVDYEVCLGGFAGYYDNSAGDDALLAVEALEAIGAHDAARAVRESAALFGDAREVADREQRQDRLVGLFARLREAEATYHAQPLGVWVMMEGYIERSMM